MSARGLQGDGGVRAAEVVAALSLATDLATGVPVEHGLHSALIATRLCEVLAVGPETTTQVYYSCLLYYIGCTATARTAAELFGDDNALTTYATPVRFGTPVELLTGMARAIAPPGRFPTVRAVQLARGLPRLARVFPSVVATSCEVAQMLTRRLGLPAAVSTLFAHETDRWDDGKGRSPSARGEAIPLPMRIVQVARDAAYQRLLGGNEYATRIVRSRSGAAFDPDVVGPFTGRAADILDIDTSTSVWAASLAAEPRPHLLLEGEAPDRALAAMGDFADLVSPYLVGHSSGVAALAAAAGSNCGLGAGDVRSLDRAAHVHDLGRVAVPARIWQQSGPLSPDDWERVRLHAYHTERVLQHFPFLAALAPIASFHHERLDGSGYHRGTTATGLAMPTRILAAADAYHAMTEPRPHRAALSPLEAAHALGVQARGGKLDPDAVAAVLAAAGQRVPRVQRPAGLTERESEVVGLLARGLQTKQVARVLRISVKTADSHIQNAYRKMGVRTRAGAAVFAMQHGLAVSGELPMGTAGGRT
jgi:HD-GYP domain-containing protein (c-di-GMP phosphodiesterase class II)